MNHPLATLVALAVVPAFFAWLLDRPSTCRQCGRQFADPLDASHHRKVGHVE